MAENTTEITDVEGDETPMTSYTSESAPAGEALPLQPARARAEAAPIEITLMTRARRERVVSVGMDCP